jgi:hypothetical protein
MSRRGVREFRQLLNTPTVSAFGAPEAAARPCAGHLDSGRCRCGAADILFLGGPAMVRP